MNKEHKARPEIKYSAQMPYKELTEIEWKDKLEDMYLKGLMKMHHHISNGGNLYKAEIFASREVVPGQSPQDVPKVTAMFTANDEMAIKMELAELARDILTTARMLKPLNPADLSVLKAIVEGDSLYEYSIGEFWQLYERFEGKYNTKGSGTCCQMKKLIGDNTDSLNTYNDSKGHNKIEPLPYFVRNILAHKANTKVTIIQNEKKDELKMAIDFLKEWTKT